MPEGFGGWVVGVLTEMYPLDLCVNAVQEKHDVSAFAYQISEICCDL